MTNTITVQPGQITLLKLLLLTRWSRQFKKTNWKPCVLSCIFIKKTWSVISKLFLLNCIFLYIGNWSKLLAFRPTYFFNMKSWRAKLRNFLGDSPFHYAALFVSRTINNNHMTLLMAFHHTHDGFWYFLDTLRAKPIPGTLPTLNLPLKIHPSSR